MTSVPISNRPQLSQSALPTDWFQTIEVQTWLQDRQLPTHSIPKMLKYIQIHFKKDNPLRIVDNDIFPQSYAHWWCYSRPQSGLETRPLQPRYPLLEKWKRIAEDYKGSDTVDAVFALLYNWLDMLSLDRLVIDNEEWREGVPRLSENKIVFNNNCHFKSRKETMQYLIDVGADILNERGWTQGFEYWKTDCQKYIF